MGSGSRPRRKDGKGTWLPDCDDQFQTLRALTGTSPREWARRRLDFDPEFEDWLEAFPLD